MSVVIELSWFEQLHAASAGVLRRIEAISRNRPEPYGTPQTDLWGNDIEAAAAELAVAKAFDRYWQPVVRDPRSLPADVGSGLQVRSTSYKTGCLLIHPEDRGLFVLAVGRMPTFRLFGPIDSDECKRQEWWRTDTGRPAFFVPQTVVDRASRPKQLEIAQ